MHHDNDETHAKATWLFRAEALLGFTGKAVLICGHYYDEYVRVDNGWKYLSIVNRLFYVTEPSKGWAEQRRAVPALTE